MANESLCSLYHKHYIQHKGQTLMGLACSGVSVPLIEGS